MEWQFELLKKLSNLYGAADKGLSDMPLEISMDIKREHLNFSLKKFYAPTINNISDVANQLLWLANPLTFNDPKDCQLGIDSRFEIYCLDKFAEKSTKFSTNEKIIIFEGKRRGLSIYHPSIWSILQKDNRFQDFAEFHRANVMKVKEHINRLDDNRYRIACFVKDFGTSNEYDTLMWAHYAQNFQGFCVEYDVEKIFDYVFQDYFVSYSKSKTKYISGQLDKDTIKKIIINGLFPVVYSSRQQSVSVGNAYKIAMDKINGKVSQDIKYNFLKALLTKDSVWKYEREWRLIISDSIVRPIDYKIPFPFAKSIIPGANASHELKLILKSISERLGLSTSFIYS